MMHATKQNIVGIESFFLFLGLTVTSVNEFVGVLRLLLGFHWSILKVFSITLINRLYSRLFCERNEFTFKECQQKLYVFKLTEHCGSERHNTIKLYTNSILYCRSFNLIIKNITHHHTFNTHTLTYKVKICLRLNVCLRLRSAAKLKRFNMQSTNLTKIVNAKVTPLKRFRWN